VVWKGECCCWCDEGSGKEVGVLLERPLFVMTIDIVGAFRMGSAASDA
jgi:hypothetical protein